MSCAVFVFHLMISIQFSLSPTWGPICPWHPAEGFGSLDTSPTISCPKWRPWSFVARQLSNLTACGCFKNFCLTVTLSPGNSSSVLLLFFLGTILNVFKKQWIVRPTSCSSTRASSGSSSRGSLFEKVVSLKHIQRIIIASILHDVDIHIFSFWRHCRDVVCLSHLLYLDHSKDEAAGGQGDGRGLWLGMGALQLRRSSGAASWGISPLPIDPLYLQPGGYLADLISSFQVCTDCFTDCFIDCFIDSCMMLHYFFCIPSWHWCLNTTKKHQIRSQFRPCAEFGEDTEWLGLQPWDDTHTHFCAFFKLLHTFLYTLATQVVQNGGGVQWPSQQEMKKMPACLLQLHLVISFSCLLQLLQLWW